MKYFIVPIATIIFLSGCTSADILRKPGEVSKQSQYAPQNETPKANNIGIMRYLNEGAEFVREARREDAYKKMYNLCNGKYELVDEADSETTPTTFINETSTGFTAQTLSSTYTYIYFRCT
ncbi:hypothetical protein K8B83_04900 [Shewanella inventionis]|uniref:DUF4156 domain-containing protein n=1 Tax=Shewanella inventionis TaxID=1738770 RepID=A0ABQ1ILM4_9GAMM|nr:hypothetical protein [Shewanella inventionis]MCL1156494.1 hypothetical protein [Shewanella inventionis]UAL44188.1 hypothetical protein K8B83_04900 [Shewanella inventionis]GGB45976.1 hypothetical protein GCM10011607_02570 [Shewanella inventionis]